MSLNFQPILSDPKNLNFQKFHAKEILHFRQKSLNSEIQPQKEVARFDC